MKNLEDKLFNGVDTYYNSNVANGLRSVVGRFVWTRIGNVVNKPLVTYGLW